MGTNNSPINHSSIMSAKQQQPVPETLLKKRKDNEATREAKLAATKERKAANKTKREVVFKRAEQYVNEYKKKEREEIRLRRVAKASGDFYVPAQPKVYFVIRLKGINEIAPKPRKILQLLRLLQITNGEANLKSVRELIYKRGYGKVNKQRIPLNDNKVIEESLGKFGIVSIEDLVHEIITAGPAFKQAANFLWPFKLSNPTGGFRTRKFKHFIEGGELGNREDNINSLIRSMN